MRAVASASVNVGFYYIELSGKATGRKVNLQNFNRNALHDFTRSYDSSQGELIGGERVMNYLRFGT